MVNRAEQDFGSWGNIFLYFPTKSLTTASIEMNPFHAMAAVAGIHTLGYEIMGKATEDNFAKVINNVAKFDLSVERVDTILIKDSTTSLLKFIRLTSTPLI